MVAESSALLEDLRAVRAEARDFTTNLFASPHQLTDWIFRERLYRVDSGGCVLLLKADRDFYHLYHWAESVASLAGALSQDGLAVVHSTIATDIVGRKEDAKRVVECHKSAGFRLHACLVRMVRAHSPGPGLETGAPDPAVTVACPSDAPLVLAFLERLLDRLSDQIPELDVILAEIERSGVLLTRCGSELGGVLIYETQGQTSTLRYWWVSERYRQQGIGARLLRTMLHHCRESRRIVLWVVESNADAIAKYEHYGFRREGLVDQIMVTTWSNT